MNNTNKTPHSCERGVLFGWGSRIRTYECQSQSLVPYRLAIPHSVFFFNIPIIPQAPRGVKMFSPLFPYIFRAAPPPAPSEPSRSPPCKAKAAPHENAGRRACLVIGSCLRLLQCGLCSSKACDRHTEGRAGNVGKAYLVAELNGGGVATVLTADTELDVGAGCTTEGR